MNRKQRHSHLKTMRKRAAERRAHNRAYGLDDSEPELPASRAAESDVKVTFMAVLLIAGVLGALAGVLTGVVVLLRKLF